MTTHNCFYINFGKYYHAFWFISALFHEIFQQSHLLANCTPHMHVNKGKFKSNYWFYLSICQLKEMGGVIQSQCMHVLKIIR